MNENANPSPFSFKNREVRIVWMENGEVWFVLKDVCDVLNIAWRGEEALAKIPDEWKGIRKFRTPSVAKDERVGGEQTLIIINEPEFSKLSLRSSKPDTEALIHDVLPSIRRTVCIPLMEKTCRASSPDSRNSPTTCRGLWRNGNGARAIYADWG